MQIVLAKDKPAEMNLSPEILDPLQKIGLSSFEKAPAPKDYSDPERSKDEVESPETLKYREMLKGYPMEEMASEIGKKDKKIAAFLIGIGKKESDWGKHSPKKDGQGCFNYWGYKGKENPTISGYSCFSSPEQAVAVVGGRIEKLISQKIDTPEKMLVWKCGRTCAGHDPAGVRKWVSDVSKYFYKLNT